MANSLKVQGTAFLNAAIIHRRCTWQGYEVEVPGRVSTNYEGNDSAESYYITEHAQVFEVFLEEHRCPFRTQLSSDLYRSLQQSSQCLPETDKEPVDRVIRQHEKKRYYARLGNWEEIGN